MKRAYNYSGLETWPLDPRSVAENHYYVLIFFPLGVDKGGLPNQ